MARLLEVTPTHPLLKEVDNQFSILNGLIKKIQVVQKDGREVVQSDLENYQLQEQVEKIQTALRGRLRCFRHRGK